MTTEQKDEQSVCVSETVRERNIQMEESAEEHPDGGERRGHWHREGRHL